MVSGLGYEWKKAYSSVQNGQCVEVRVKGQTVLVTDSKVRREIGDAATPTLSFSSPAWKELINQEVEYRALTTAAIGRVLFTHQFEDGTTFTQAPNDQDGLSWRVSTGPTVLEQLTPAEIDAWADGARNGEFDPPDYAQ